MHKPMSVILAFHSVSNMDNKQLHWYFLVYSPSVWDRRVHNYIMDKIIHSPSLLCTKEYGQTGMHPHTNYLYQSTSRDAYVEKRKMSAYLLKNKIVFGKPTFVLKNTTQPNNVICYMTKEGKIKSSNYFVYKPSAHSGASTDVDAERSG